MQNIVYEVLFFLFLFFISKVHNMRWKNLALVFDENASFSFYGPSKFFQFGSFEHFFQNFRVFQFFNFQQERSRIPTLILKVPSVRKKIFFL